MKDLLQFAISIVLQPVRIRISKNRISFLFTSLLLLSSAQTGQAQVIDEDLFGCNTAEPFVNGSRFHVSLVTGSMPGSTILNVQRWTGAYGLDIGSIANSGNVINADTADAATMNYLVSVSGGQRLTVQSNSGTIPAGYFTGFDIQNSTLINSSLLSTLTMKTYLGNTLQESVSGGSGALSVSLINNNGMRRVGFISTKPFDRIMIDQSQTLGLSLGATKIYYAIIQKFCAGPALLCNTDNRMTTPRYPVFVDGRNTGIDGLACLDCYILNPRNAIDSISGNYTQVYIPAGVATSSAYAVTDGATVYATDSSKPLFAGFDIDNPNLAGANVLTGITVATTLHGLVQEQADMNKGLISVSTSLLNGTGRQTVGFIPAHPFDGIKIIFNSAVKANIGTTRIYGFILKQFCENELPCNALTVMQNPAYPVYVNGLRTGIDADDCAACQMNNVENIVSANAVSPATITMTAGAVAKASVSVANPLEIYPSESFAGFDIESASLLSGNLLASLDITLYNKGVEVQSGIGQSLLAGAGSSLITGGPDRQIVGIISRVPFDEVQINIRKLAGVDLGIIKIYKAYLQKTCALPVGCNFSRLMNTTTDGAVIDAAHTGIKGGVCAGCLAQNPWNAVSDDSSDYARLYNTAGALVTNNLAVAMPAYTLPAGSFAGFTIRKNSFLVAAALFPCLTITTYNNGVKQESRSGTSLIDLTALLHWLGTPDAVYTPGFYTSKPFDEIEISVGSLAAALDQYVDVYGAYVDARGYTAGAGLNCNILNPDLNVTSVNVPVAGNVATNDKIQPGTTYGGAVTVPGNVSNPSSDSPIINEDGSYTFTGTKPGVYEFEVPACAPGVSVNCPMVLLTITVLNNTPAVANPPVANTDIASTEFNKPVTIPSLSNDKAGSPEYSLSPSSVMLTDLNGDASGNTSAGGTATVDPATGNINYTPPADFVGTDTIRYTVCDNQPSPECASACQIVKVMPPGMVNTTQAADDYYSSTSNTTAMTVSAADGLLKNDIDPEGDSVYAIPMDTVIAGEGRIQVATDGSLVFTPASEFAGTAVIPYSIRDNGNPQAEAGATVYILIKPLVPDLKPVITVQPSTIHGTTNLTVTVDVQEVNKVPTSGLVTVYVVKNRLITLTYDSAATTINGKTVQNALWTMDGSSNPSYYVLTTTAVVPPGAVLSFGFNGVFTPGATKGQISITSIITAQSGGETNSGNNLDAENINFFEN